MEFKKNYNGIIINYNLYTFVSKANLYRYIAKGVQNDNMLTYDCKKKLFFDICIFFFT